jgi:hypothetical protein
MAKQMSNGIPSKIFQGVKFLLTANFYLSVIVLMMGSISSLSGSDVIFDFSTDFYNPLLNNLRIMMIYMAISEIGICVYGILRKKFQAIILTGFFLVLITGSLEFYGQINNISAVFFIYRFIAYLVRRAGEYRKSLGSRT